MKNCESSLRQPNCVTIRCCSGIPLCSPSKEVFLSCFGWMHSLYQLSYHLVSPSNELCLLLTSLDRKLAWNSGKWTRNQQEMNRHDVNVQWRVNLSTNHGNTAIAFHERNRRCCSSLWMEGDNLKIHTSGLVTSNAQKRHLNCHARETVFLNYLGID